MHKFVRTREVYPNGYAGNKEGPSLREEAEPAGGPVFINGLVNYAMTCPLLPNSAAQSGDRRLLS